MRINLCLIGIDATRENNQRHTILTRVFNRVNSVQRPRSDRRNQDPRRTRSVICAFRHEAGCVLVLAQNEGDARLFQSIEQGEHFAPRHAKRPTASGLIKTFGKDISCAHLGIPVFKIPFYLRHGTPVRNTTPRVSIEICARF